jgi:DNA-binding SARP family transcriptional activator
VAAVSDAIGTDFDDVTFGLLGPLHVWDGTKRRPLTSGRQRIVLAALLSEPNKVLPLHRLAELLWEGDPSSRAQDTLYTYVMRLRRALGPTLGRRIHTQGGYVLEIDPAHIDIEKFRALGLAGKAALDAGSFELCITKLTEALGLWRGAPYSDIPSETFQRDEAGRLEEQRLITLEWYFEAELRSGHCGEIIPQLRRLVAEYPLRERFAAQLMLALAQAGRLSEALGVFDSTRHVLSEELGVDPSRELADLHVRILQGQPTRDISPALIETVTLAGRPVPAQLPADLPDFTGRWQCVRELCGLFRNRPGPTGHGAGTKVAIIRGGAGVGKTALAVHVANVVRDQFPDGQLYADLAGSTDAPVPARVVIGQFLRSLGGEPSALPEEERELTGLLRTRFAGKKLLIVLDDVRSADQLAPLLPGTGDCGVIVTTRSRLVRVEGDRLMPLDVLGDAAAHALFGRLVGSERAAAEPEAADIVLRACSGLPLAIRIAGYRVSSRPEWRIAELANRLAGGARRLDELGFGGLSVRAALDASLRLVPGSGTSGSRAAFRLLGLWPGPQIGAGACAALLGTTPDEAEAVLEDLVDAHVMQPAEPGRYKFPQLTRLHARELAAGEPANVRNDAVRRVVAWYVRAAESANRVLYPDWRPMTAEGHAAPHAKWLPGTVAEALAWYRAERECIAAAVRQAASAGLNALVVRLAAGAWEHVRRSDGAAEWTGTLEVALTSARAARDGAAEAWALRALATTYVAAGQCTTGVVQPVGAAGRPFRCGRGRSRRQ